MEEPVSVEVTVKPEPIDHDDNKAKNDNNEESLQLSNEEIWIKPEHIEDETEDPVTEDPITEEAETNVKVESKESGEVEAAQSSNDEKSKICLPLKKRLDKEATSDGGQGGGVKAEPGDKEPDEDGKPAPVQQPKMETPVMYSYEITKNIEIVTISEEERQVEYEETKKSRQHMRHVCEHCSLGFVLKQAYLVHMKVHSPESGEHECVLCHTRMKTADMLYRHRLRHYRRYRCLLCWTRFKDKDTAACHVMNDHAQQTFECEHCGKGFKRPQYLKRHVEQHHTKPLRLECAVCLRVFHERGWYRTHIRSHNEEIRAMTVKVPATCSICSREFKTKEGLKRHLLTHDNEDVACELCGEKCKNRNTLAQHYLKVHNEKYEGAPEQTCPQCMRVCATRVILKRHMKRMHSDRTKKYQCDHCQRLYLTKAEVRSHIAWSHLAGAARGGHACACGRVFRSPSLLRDHRARAHAPVPPPRTHACDICNKAFANKQVMNRHRKGHSNEMYPCNECGLLFKTQPYVKVHYQIKHLNMTRAEIKEQRKRNKNTIPQNNIHKSVSPEPAGSDQGQDPLIMEVEVKLEPGEAQDSVGTE
ncbi:unnamed protein product [Chrysodeixis includens]|uniref:C2H2-type domain-containing protein n=1 Tax=Chrysodeixis includens TaxID=689277 RepID=A0A9P0FXC9_CHRIL|nr:unnamed protein product [Chrysodeixis includens]